MISSVIWRKNFIFKPDINIPQHHNRNVRCWGDGNRKEPLTPEFCYFKMRIPIFPFQSQHACNTSPISKNSNITPLMQRRYDCTDVGPLMICQRSEPFESRSAWFNSHTDRANFNVEPVPAGWSHRTHACIRMTHTATRCVAEASTRFASRIRFRKGWKERTRKTWCSSGGSTESHHHKTMSRRLSDAFVWRVVTLVRTVRGSSQERIWYTALFLWAASQETFTLKGNTCRVDSQAKDSCPTKLSNKTAKSLHTYGTHCLRWQRSRSKWSRTGFPVRFSGTNSIHRWGKRA